MIVHIIGENLELDSGVAGEPLSLSERGEGGKSSEEVVLNVGDAGG